MNLWKSLKPLIPKQFLRTRLSAKPRGKKNLKCGKCQIFHCFGLVDTGHAGIQNAAIRGKITKIHHVDVHTKMILGIGKTTVEVYGE